MTEQYNPHTAMILDLWIQQLSQRTEIDPLVLEQIQELIRNGQAGSETRIQELVATYKEMFHEPH